MATSAKYNISDLLPDTESLSNSGVPMECPLCGEQQIRCWDTLGLRHPLLHCRSCNFTGNPVHLEVEIHGEPYAVAATGYDDYSEEIQHSKTLPDISHSMLQSMDQSREALRNRSSELQGPYANIFGQPPTYTTILRDHIGYWTDDLKQEWDIDHSGDLFAMPEYLFGDILSTINLVGDGYTHAIRAPIGIEDQPVCGILDLSHGKDALYMTSCPGDVADMVRIMEASQRRKSVPLALIRPELYPLTHHMSDRPLFVSLMDFNIHTLHWALSCQSVRFSNLRCEDITQKLEYGGANVISDAYESSMDPADLIQWAAREDHDSILDVVEQADVDRSFIHDIHKHASPEAATALQDRWGYLQNCSTASYNGDVYKRREEGGYNRIESSGEVSPVGNTDMQVTQRIIGDKHILCRGWANHMGRTTQAELVSPFTEKTKDDMLRAFADMGIQSTPDWRCSSRQWMKINYSFSHPDTYPGRESCGYDEGYYLPGVTILDDRIQSFGRIAQRGLNFLNDHEVDRTSEVLSHQPKAHVIMSFLFGLGMHIMCTRRMWLSTATHMIVNSHPTSRSLQSIFQESGITGGIEGYVEGGHNKEIEITSPSSKSSSGDHSIIMPDIKGTPWLSVPPTAWSILWSALQVDCTTNMDQECVCQNMIECLKQTCRQRGIRYSWGWLNKILVCRNT